jgi:hypothetical protein
VGHSYPVQLYVLDALMVVKALADFVRRMSSALHGFMSFGQAQVQSSSYVLAGPFASQALIRRDKAQYNEAMIETNRTECLQNRRPNMARCW